MVCCLTLNKNKDYIWGDRVRFLTCLRVSNLTLGITFFLVGVVFPVWSIDRIPLLYKLNFKSVNTQVHEKKIIYYTSTFLSEIYGSHTFAWARKSAAVRKNEPALIPPTRPGRQRKSCLTFPQRRHKASRWKMLCWVTKQ